MLVASQDFVEGVLVRTILPKNNPPTIVHDKVLNLIQVSTGVGRVDQGESVPAPFSMESARAGEKGPPVLLSFCWLQSVSHWGRLACLLTGCSECGRPVDWAFLWRGCLGDAVKGPASQGRNFCSLGVGRRVHGETVSCGYQLRPLVPSQSWADAFRSSPDLTGVVAVYEDLRRKGLEFPMTDLDMLSPIHTPQRVRRPTDGSSGKGGRNSHQRLFLQPLPISP